MNVLVVGATGLLGFEIAKRLVAQGHRVAGLVRPQSLKEEALRALGVEIRHGDLRAADTLEAACQGMEVIVSTATAITSAGAGNSLAAVDQAGYQSLIAAARNAGVRRFLFSSTSPKYGKSPLLESKRATERALQHSGMEYVVLQCSLFMEIWFSPAVGWDLKAGKARIFGKGDAPISWISARDVAAYAVAVLDARAATNQLIPLGGPEALSPRAAHQVLEATLGKTINVTTIPSFMPTIGAAVLRPFNPKLASLMALGTETLSGDAIDLTRARSIATVRLTPLAEWARAQV